MKRDILSEALEIKEELILWRRSLHRIPEVGLILPETFRFVTEQLDRMGITYKTIRAIPVLWRILATGRAKQLP